MTGPPFRDLGKSLTLARGEPLTRPCDGRAITDRPNRRWLHGWVNDLDFQARLRSRTRWSWEKRDTCPVTTGLEGPIVKTWI